MGDFNHFLSLVDGKKNRKPQCIEDINRTVHQQSLLDLQKNIPLGNGKANIIFRINPENVARSGTWPLAVPQSDEKVSIILKWL
jgi:hypothetical protein